MASAIYPKAKESMLQGGINLSSGTVKAALVDTGTYTYSAAHDFYNDVSGVVGTPQTIGSKTFTNGLFDGADVTFTGVTGSSAEAIIIYIDTGTASTSALIAYIDSATGLPVTPNSGDISIVWHASGIFQL
jgi:hypothetical protein